MSAGNNSSMVSLLEREHVVHRFTEKEASSIRILFLRRESHQLIVQRPLNRKKVMEDVGQCVRSTLVNDIFGILFCICSEFALRERDPERPELVGFPAVAGRDVETRSELLFCRDLRGQVSPQRALSGRYLLPVSLFFI